MQQSLFEIKDSGSRPQREVNKPCGDRAGMSSHQSGSMMNDEWLTPPEIIKALGPFDLDPCAPVKRPWDMADKHYTVEDNGLIQPWFGRVWCNPPYGQECIAWIHKLADHGNGIALIFARTETKLFFQEVWNRATALLFLEGRLFFHRVDGGKTKTNAGAPSVLIAYGPGNADRLRTCGIRGRYINL